MRNIFRSIYPVLVAVVMLGGGLLCSDARAVPTFNRQTGQNCVACHAGGQFPELTPYGRMFKLTGYTLGTRTVPISAMAVATYSDVSNTSKSDAPTADFQKNRKVLFATGSVFLAGKITDNLGAFTQITYDPYASQNSEGHFRGHSNVDNVDIRYVDRFISEQQDLIIGLSANNNPSVSDPWNTAAAWMQYVPVPSPTSSRFVDGNAPYTGYGAGGNIAGLTAYAYLNRSIYAEFGGYGTSKGVMSFMSAGTHAADTTQLRGLNPYWRLALNREWGPHALMVGTSGMVAEAYDDPLDTSSSSTVHRFKDLGFDAQYQYLLDPHSVTAQFAYMRNHTRYSADARANADAPFYQPGGGVLLAPGNASDTTHTLRAKLTYVYQARYGASLGAFRLTGSTNTANQSAGYDVSGVPTRTDGAGSNLSGNPGTNGWTVEGFWTPMQYMRIGAQYTAYGRYNGATHNYDGFGRNARDNNTLFLYTWVAY